MFIACRAYPRLGVGFADGGFQQRQGAIIVFVGNPKLEPGIENGKLAHAADCKLIPENDVNTRIFDNIFGIANDQPILIGVEEPQARLLISLTAGVCH